MEIILEKIMLKAYKINKETKHTIFIRYSGHIDGLNVEIYINGWKERKKPDIDKYIYLDNREALKRLEEILREFEKLEKDEKIFTKEQLKTINSCLLTTKRSLKYILSNRDNELDIKDIIKKIDNVLINF